MDMDAAVGAIEETLRYRFTDRSLLVEALTHSSYPDSASYERLEFVGDAVLGCAFTNFLYVMYRDFDPGQLSLIKAANVSTEKLARVAVKHGLYMYIRHTAPDLAQKVREFVYMALREDGLAIHGGSMKAPKILADLVEALAAAVFVDCGFDMRRLWLVFRPILEPIVTPEDLEVQPQPVTRLFQLCQKEGKPVEIRHWRKGSHDVATVFIDGQTVASGISEHKEFAKLAASKKALQKISQGTLSLPEEADTVYELERAKPMLHELCAKKKWPKPEYKVESKQGPPHDRKFRCSVTIKADPMLFMKGDLRPRIREAENSVSLLVLQCLHDSGHARGHWRK